MPEEDDKEKGPLVEQDPNPKLDDAGRKLHRLQTARRAIYIGLGLVGIFSLTPSVCGYFSCGLQDASYEILRDGVVAASTIVTLALGFIAGSNIE